MSNLSVNLDPKNAAEVNAEPPPANAFNKTKHWSFIQSDLEKALHTWVTLEKAELVLSPEEVQFLEIKTIIAQLKGKLEQF